MILFAFVPENPSCQLLGEVQLLQKIPLVLEKSGCVRITENKREELRIPENFG